MERTAFSERRRLMRPERGSDAEFETVLRAYAEGEMTAAEVRARPGLEPSLRLYVGLAAAAMTGPPAVFEAEVWRAIESGVAPERITEVLLHIADSGIAPPTRAFDVARRASEVR